MADQPDLNTHTSFLYLQLMVSWSQSSNALTPVTFSYRREVQVFTLCGAGCPIFKIYTANTKAAHIDHWHPSLHGYLDFLPHALSRLVQSLQWWTYTRLPYDVKRAERAKPRLQYSWSEQSYLQHHECIHHWQNTHKCIHIPGKLRSCTHWPLTPMHLCMAILIFYTMY